MRWQLNGALLKTNFKHQPAPVPTVTYPAAASDTTVELKGIIVIEHSFWPQFQELVYRGVNLWPDARPEMKEFADLITEGKVLQDYFAQANEARIERVSKTTINLNTLEK